MTNITVCLQCGAALEHEGSQCPRCGAALSLENQPADYEPDSRKARGRKLLYQAQAAQRAGDIPLALRHAREALSLKYDCSATHVLLGQLYELSNNDKAAKYHFRQALAVSAQYEDAEAPSTLPPTTRAPLRGWMALILVGCVLFSGLATIISLWPASFDLSRPTIVDSTNARPSLPHAPDWTWRGDRPSHASHVLPVNMITPDGPSAPGAVNKLPVPAPASDGDQSPSRLEFPAAASLADADKAYVNGEYERAAAIYEVLLDESDAPNPRLHQDLAWCYQNSGDSHKASDHLESAIQGYRNVLKLNPDDAGAKDGVARCEAAARELHPQ